ncbi:MAG TPA: alpha-amylase/4-alpha-glucanotransferase domain-containing protein [Candidatus Acidoferrum sp.]|nr:alpha-amylase/4-alpha-glucanotransferase domain-containing protein [Candidatus Acidoferrum sp.]
MPKFQFVLLIHAHQPVGNFHDVLESAYQKSYLPFLEVLSRHPSIHLGLHFSGPLLEWIEHAHPEYFRQIGDLVSRGQVEMVGGGFYEPILISIPVRDRARQISRLADYLHSHFGRRPSGAWLAERVWEPQLPSILAPAGVRYTLVDDNHFLAAGFEPGQLFGSYLAEDQGAAVEVLPGLKSLRYLIPFRSVDETLQFLRQAAEEHPGGAAYMGDDLEKFGVWPGTHTHCYTNGWLDSLFTALEHNSAWLETCPPEASLDLRSPLGRADLPAASYSEMMEWALPTPARRRYHDLVHEFSSHATAQPFFHGGTWRGFFSKYPESNLLHKKMLHVSAKVRSAADSPSMQHDPSLRRCLCEAETHLFRGQCNDAYWHGVFGGLYTPHLRTALWQSLAHAESLADRVLHAGAPFSSASSFDFDSDGQTEAYLTSNVCAALFKPSDGGTLCALECRTSQACLINSISRREESYHTRLRDAGSAHSGAVSIHEQTRSKESNLDRWLYYDRWPRHCFRLLLFDGQRGFDDFSSCRLGENAPLAGGPYRIDSLGPGHLSLSLPDSSGWTAKKDFAVTPLKRGFRISVDVVLSRSSPLPGSFLLGVEMVFNLLAPSSPDRFFELNGERHPLRWSAVAPASPLRVVDEWQKFALRLSSPGALEWWISPIETVSESEDGFERLYQGSQILAVWPVEFSASLDWRGFLELDVIPFP